MEVESETIPTTSREPEEASDSEEALSRQPSETSLYATEDEEEARIQLGPKMSIKQHLEKDKVNYLLNFISIIMCLNY